VADELATYLDRLSGRLGLPEPWATDVRAEVASHLAEAVDESLAAGLDDVAATREALSRLGSPDALADGLRAAHQTRRRLVAGIAGGATAAIGNGVFGTVLGWMLAVGLLLAATVVVTVVGSLAGVRFDTFNMPSATWEGLLTALALTVGAFLAGRGAVRATSARSRRPTRSVAAGWSVAGAVLLTAWLLFVFRASLATVVVAAELLVPVGFVLGATVGADRSGPRRAPLLLLAIAITSCAGLFGLVAVGAQTSQQLQAGGSGPYTSMDEMWHAQGFDPLGRPAPESMQGVFGDQSLSQANGVATMTVSVVDAAGLRGWTGLALEAWRGDSQTLAILPGETHPFASAPASFANGQLQAAVRVDNVRNVDTYAAVLTGVGPDGVRYVLSGPNGLQGHFVGTIWDWLTAAGT
jgi:hypothetical protein